MRGLVAVAAAATLVLAHAGAAVASPDPAYPTGTFTLGSTTEYLHDNPLDDRVYAYFTLHRSTLADDVTPAASIVVTVDPGDGNPPEPWAYHAGPGWNSFSIGYDHTGTFSPTITLTDTDAHTTTIELGTVTVLPDRTAPSFTLTKPRYVHRTGAWHRIVGTYTDAGVGLNYIGLRVLQKRHGTWYAFSYASPPDKKVWLRGKRTLTATLAMPRFAQTYGLSVTAHRWTTKWIPRLTRGPLVLVAEAVDNNDNTSVTKTYSVRLTRR